LVPGVAYKISTLFTFDPSGFSPSPLAVQIGLDPTNITGSTPGIIVAGATPDGNGLDEFNVFGPDSYYGVAPNWDAGTITFPILPPNDNAGTETLALDFQWVGPFNSIFQPYLYASSIATYTFTVGDLFTAGSDAVNFNSLLPGQQAAITAGANLYNGLGGSDSVVLPSVANYNESLGGSGGTVGWDSTQTFQTGSLAGDHYSILGSDGNYKIALGSGSDSVTINGNGSNTITDGSGADSITINGSGANTINLATGTANVSLTGSNNNIDFFTANEAATLNLQTGFTEHVSGFGTGDIIDLKGFGNLTLSAGTDVFGGKVPGEVNLYTPQGNFVGSLFFDSSLDYKSLKPVSDGAGGTNLEVDSAAGPQDPTGNNIDWSFIHGWESPGGVTVLRPYVSTGLSGLTMAQGVDIGGQGNNQTNVIQQVFTDWQSNPNLSFISSFAGSSPAQALAMLQPQAKIGGNPSSLSVSLTTTEANAITLATETAIYNQLSQDYTAAAAQHGQGGWDTLTANQQTGILDLAYNFGVDRFEQLHLWPLLAQHQWNDAVVGTSNATGVYFLGGEGRAASVAARRVADGVHILDGTGVANAPHLETGTTVASKTTFDFSVDNLSDYHALDTLGHSLLLASDAGVPEINSLTIPLLGDASEYLISTETGSVWSQSQSYQPGDVVHFGTGGVDGLKVTMLDADNHPIQGSPDFTFFVTFASTGNYSATVTSIGDNVADNFGGDGVSDILFHNDNGITAIYDMHADGSSNAIQLGAVDLSWKIEDTDKFGSGSDGDILWQNSNTGQIVYWSITADQKTPGYTDLGTLGPQWQIETHDGSSDFTGDGADDILLRNTSTNDLVFWNMQGGHAANTVDLGTAPNAQWDISGTGDFNGDGKADILWHNNVTGQAFIWASGGTGPTTQLGTINPTWQVAGIGDFKGDGVDDILWFNTSTHQAVYWDDHADGTSTTVDLGITPNGFTFDKPRDLTGDGTADFLLHNSSSGVIVEATNDGGTVNAFHVIDTLSTSWHIV
jgi:hypothetical protein